jgi:hypothetical protein
MTEWFIALSTGEKAAVISAAVGVLALIITLLKRQKPSQNIDGEKVKAAQVKGKKNNITIN